jgi:hypothetical protein
VEGEKAAVKFLESRGLDIELARAAVREIALQGGKLK